MAVVFAGINTNEGSLEHVGREIERQLIEQNKNNTVNLLTIYPYDDAISGDTLEDIAQVLKNSYEVNPKAVKDMARRVSRAYKGEDALYFVGYSGGGIAASRTAEALEEDEDSPRVSAIVRVGSPDLWIDVEKFGKRTRDIADVSDPIAMINIPRAGLAYSPNPVSYLWGLENIWYDGHDVHTSYFKSDAKDKKGVSNLTKTVSEIIKKAQNVRNRGVGA